MRTTWKAPRELPVLLLLLITTLIMGLFVPAFRTESNLTALGESAAYIGILACGEALPLFTAGLDISVGSTLALSSCAAATVLTLGWPWPIAAAVGLLAGACAGWFNGMLITWRRMPPILATLATFLIFRHGAGILTHDHSYGPFPHAFNRIGSGWVPVLLLVAITLLFTFLVQRATFGRWLLSVGGNEMAARLSAVPIEKVKRRAYLLCGLCAGLAGLIVMAFNNTTQASVGQGTELDAIAACVVGGTRITGGEGSVVGAALGAVLLALLRDAFVLTGRPVSQYGVITGGVILLTAILERLRRANINLQEETV
ncbi:MAG TPA: ABC transporter permease [Chthonomonas sp.]|uniref:ABC transporter permease n=1 Tax=Chthonomonas sp. TaxID=2282153 RepID=UPI002B4B42E9|nr:ABC transporter permease [Chthonomonas sp.]HLH80932.1 ABC transporter permease [Chthonomonas sp.]